MANKRYKQYLENQIKAITERKLAGKAVFGDPKLLKDYTEALKSLS